MNAARRLRAPAPDIIVALVGRAVEVLVYRREPEARAQAHRYCAEVIERGIHKAPEFYASRQSASVMIRVAFADAAAASEARAALIDLVPRVFP